MDEILNHVLYLKNTLSVVSAALVAFEVKNNFEFNNDVCNAFNTIMDHLDNHIKTIQTGEEN